MVEFICPACNGLYPLTLSCPFCGQLLTDTGAVRNYLDAYSPYNDVKRSETCCHLFFCANCGYDLRHMVQAIVT